MNIAASLRNLTKLEKILWIISILVIAGSTLIFPEQDWLTVIASLIGATALIFVGKGDALGQLLSILFAVVYAIISYRFRYFGEMITYVGMTAPSAMWALVVWLKNPYSDQEVRVANMTGRKWIFLFLSAVAVTGVMWLVLAYFQTANLLFSTISVTTSYLASILTILRSPYYAIFYAVNDIVLIVLWILATLVSISYLPMVLCFIIFLINDCYGFWNWRQIKARQQAGESIPVKS